VDRYAFPILDVAIGLHGEYTGAADPIPADRRSELVTWLRWRLAEWTRPAPLTADFDEAVRALCVIALSEADADRFGRRPSECYYCARQPDGSVARDGACVDHGDPALPVQTCPRDGRRFRAHAPGFCSGFCAEG